MLRRAPALAFCTIMSAVLGAGFPEVVVVASLAVAAGAASYAWLSSSRPAGEPIEAGASSAVRA